MTIATDKAIDRSIARNETVTLSYSTAADNDLVVKCDGHAWADRAHEFWGADKDGYPWRVHLIVDRDTARGVRTTAVSAGDEDMVALCDRIIADGEDDDLDALARICRC